MARISPFMNGLVVPGTTCVSIGALESVPADLFAHAPGFFASRAWWEIVLSHAIPPGARPHLLLVGTDALFPMLLDPMDGEFRALTTPYTCLYEPLIAGPRAAAFDAFARYCRTFPVTRLDALDEALQAEVAAAARRSGLAIAHFAHFGNWFEDVMGLDWTGYLARRPGALRETIRRRARRVERAPGAVFRLFRDQTDLETGIAAFETVYASSWKQPEPWPDFNPAQIQAAAALGIMRLGVYWIDGTAAAAQFWIVEHGHATVLKLAHDEAFKALSLGTVLTARMIRHMMEEEGATVLDFGRGDDPYKKDWVSSRRQRMGLLLINPRAPKGLAALVRHGLGRLRARWRVP